MNATNLRPIEASETDDHSAMRPWNVETVGRGCALVVALTLAGFFGAWLLK